MEVKYIINQNDNLKVKLLKHGEQLVDAIEEIFDALSCYIENVDGRQLSETHGLYWLEEYEYGQLQLQWGIKIELIDTFLESNEISYDIFNPLSSDFIEFLEGELTQSYDVLINDVNNPEQYKNNIRRYLSNVEYYNNLLF